MPQKIPLTVLSEGITDLTLLNEWGDYLAKDHPDNRETALTSSQIRRFFGAVKRIQADFMHLKSEILLLEPKLAYAVGRSKQGAKIKEFYLMMSPLIRDINQDKTKFKNFVSLFEAIVAYHKAANGK